MNKKGKYTEQGLFNKRVFENFNLPNDICSILEKTANMAIAEETKKKYKTALNNVQRCESETNENLNFPWEQREILLFTGWCIKRNLKAQSIKSYLSGISKLHLALGLEQLDTSSPLMREIFNGQDNKFAQGKSKLKNKRLPCTQKLLRLLKTEIRMSNIKNCDKLMVWTACSVAFYGALRPGEALCKYENFYDPMTTLCKSDVKFVKGIGEERDAIHLTIKNSKTNKSGIPETIIIYSTNDETCPVNCCKKLINANKNVSVNAPFFTNANGKPLTIKKFNELLKILTSSTIQNGVISAHSFRIGITSLLAKKGYSNESLKQIGRWSSRAYKAYIRMGRTKRHEMAVACSLAAKN